MNECAGYEDMLLLPHHVSRNHPQMDSVNRAAQFAPFQALTGYQQVIHEVEQRVRAEMEKDFALECDKDCHGKDMDI